MTPCHEKLITLLVTLGGLTIHGSWSKKVPTVVDVIAYINPKFIKAAM